MGKSLNGKELGTGISQRKDGLYQARFVDRFGKRRVIYDKTITGIRKKLRDEQVADEKGLNVVSGDMTLDEWFDKWLEICKKNCRNNTKQAYRTHYNRVKADLGWRKLDKLNLVILQEAINRLESDNERKNSKKILVDMLDKAVDSDLIIKNVARQINTVITKEEKRERCVLSKEQTAIFLNETSQSFYKQLYVLALETGMRTGELTGLQWDDVDFSNRVIHVRHSLCYFRSDGKYIFEMHDTKTKNGRRDIPMTVKAYGALKEQYMKKMSIVNKGVEPLAEYKNLVFVTKNNRPTTTFILSESLRGILQNINKKSEVEFPKVTPHCLRHTFATRCVEAGMQPKSLQKILGHGTLQMTMDLYCHVMPDTLTAEMLKFEEATTKVV